MVQGEIAAVYGETDAGTQTDRGKQRHKGNRKKRENIGPGRRKRCWQTETERQRWTKRQKVGDREKEGDKGEGKVEREKLYMVSRIW